jgi:hypothetical protein
MPVQVARNTVPSAEGAQVCTPASAPHHCVIGSICGLADPHDNTVVVDPRRQATAPARQQLEIGQTPTALTSCVHNVERSQPRHGEIVARWIVPITSSTWISLPQQGVRPRW